MVVNKKLLLNYKRDGERVLSIRKHYKEVVSPVAPKYSRYDVERSNTVVCPFHVDNDPSFGVIRGKDGVDHYHCFGCKAYGDFIDFYRGVEKNFRGRSISESQAIEEIITRWGIPKSDLEISDEVVVLGREQQMDSIKSIYTIADYERDIRMGLLLNRPIAYYNAKLLEYISDNVSDLGTMDD